MVINVLLPNFPDWAVPLSKIVPIFRTTNAYDLNDETLTFSFQFNYWFQKVDDVNYMVKIFVTGRFIDEDENLLPLFLDLDLYIVNERNYHFHQTVSK